MKKKDRELIDNVRKALETVSENEALPDSLSRENISAKVENQEQSQRANMSHKQKKTTAIATVAAVFVLCVCVFFAHRASKNPSAVVPTPKTTQAEESPYGDAPLYPASDYDVIEQRFTQAARAYLKEQEVAKDFDGVTAAYNGTEKTAEAPTLAEAPKAEGGAATSEETNSFSKTNVQVEGVDEADIVKTDGKYIYAVSIDFEYIKNSDGAETHDTNDGVVKIVDIRTPAEMKVVSSVMPKAKGKQLRIREIYTNSNNLIVICNEWNYNEKEENAVNYGYYYGDFDEKTLVVVYDISDRAEPKEKGRYEQDGRYLSSRLIGNRVYVFSNFDVNIYKDEEQVRKDCVPLYGENGKLSRIPAKDISIMRSTDRMGYLVIGSINFYGEELSSTAKAVLGGGEESYCTGDTLYISNSVYDYKLYTEQELTDEEITVDMGRTEIFAFLLNEGRIEYKNYGSVSGIVNDQFSMDEYNGYFRVATTVGWNGYSIVTVLDKNLKRVGELTKIAEGETIYSVRFAGNTAYVVTFKNTDPLFVIDLSDPKKPTVLGQLEMPGFSRYMHPVGDKYLLGIGEDRDENGELPDGKMNTKLSVFDISDPMNPTEVSVLVLDGYSEAQDNHKVFTVLPDGSFMIPINMYFFEDGSEQNVLRSVRFSVDENGQLVFGRSYYNEHITDVYDSTVTREAETATDATEDTTEIQPETELTTEAVPPEGEGFESFNDVYTYYNDIDRIVYANSVVYNIGELYIEAFDLNTGEKLGDVQITDSKCLFDRDTTDIPMVVYNGATVPEEPTSNDTVLEETTQG